MSAHTPVTSANEPTSVPPTTAGSTSSPLVPQSSTCALLTWQDPVATGKVFGTILAGLVLVKINVASIAFHALYIALLISAGAEYVGKLLTGQGFVTKYLGGRPKSHVLTFRKLVLPAVGDAAGAAEAHIHKVLFAQDIEATLKAAGVSYILYKLTSWFSVYSLVFVSVLLAFSFPPFYQANKKEIDAAVAQYTKLAKEKTSEYSALAHKKAAPHIDTFVKKTGPVGSYLQSKFPTRTAGSTVNSPYSAPPPTNPVTTKDSVPAAKISEPSTGISTGSSQFPLAPTSVPSGTSEVKDNFKVQVPEPTL